MIVRIQLLILAAALAALPAAGEGRRVIFVDNGRAEDGNGSYEKPFRHLIDAQRSGSFSGGEIIYVAEGSAPYDESIGLQRGQMLIGAAYGLDALRSDLKIEIDAPPVPAVSGPGPTIHGTVTVAGDNLVAGCTIVADVYAALVAARTQGSLAIRNVWFRTSMTTYAITIQDFIGPVTISGGGWIATAGGGGLSISGGASPVSVEHFPMSGDASTALFIGARTGGVVRFASGSSIKIERAIQDAIVISSAKGTITFDDPIQVAAAGSRALVISASDKVIISGGSSRLSAVNASAIDISDANVDIALQNVSADGSAVGIALNKVRGRFVIAGETGGGRGSGGTIRKARAYGMRIEQSSGVSISHVNITDTGGAGKLPCPEDMQTQQNVACRAGLFLRHVTQSSFDDIVIDGSGQAGVSGNNLGNVTFNAIEVRRAGSHPAVLLQETSGTVAFHGCTIADSAAGEVAIEQRFNRGKIVFDRCTITAPEGSIAPAVQARVAGFGGLEISINDLRSRVAAGKLIDMAVLNTAHASLMMRDAYVDAVGIRDGIVSVKAADGSQVCVDAGSSHFETDPASKAVRISSQSGQSRVLVVNGSKAVIDAPAGSVTEVASCATLQ